MVEKGMSFLMYIISPPPVLCFRSCLTAVKPSIVGVFALLVSFVSWIETMSALCSWILILISSIFLASPLMLSWIILRFGSFLDAVL